MAYVPDSRLHELVSAIGKIGIHDHLCLIYETQDEQFSAALPFMKIGLERGEKCLYVVDDNTAAVVISGMKAAGMDVETAVESGKLAIVSKQDAYLKQGYFDPDWMIDFLGSATDEAKAAGFSALRITGEMTWVLSGDAGTERLMEYEAKLNYFFPDNDALAICQYNRNRFSPEIIKGVISTHPLVICGGVVCRNFYYVPPDDFLGEEQPAKEIDRLLANITNRGKVDEALRVSEERMRLFFERQLVGMAITSPEKGWIQVNNKLCEMLGYSPEELARLSWAEMTYPEDLAPDEAQFERMLNGEIDSYMLEKRFVRKDGGIVFTNLAVGCVRRANRSVDYVLALLEDITERKHAEESIQKLNKELLLALNAAEAANKAKSVFLANMSHELRTPLNAVLGFAQLMKVAPDATQQQIESLDIITRSGEHLLNLINNILDISKIESGRVPLEESATDLHQLIQEMRSLMYVKTKEKGLDFTVEQSPELPRYVKVDSGKLRQVLINLIGNAAKYTKSGGVILQAGAAKWESPQSARVRFEVKDSGPGIRVEDVERIFQPFVQLADQPVVEAGTGLGLTICRQYVELMGGQLGVSSQLDIGSVFYFEIPVAALPAEEMPVEPRHGRVIGIREGQPRYRLLIVEDQPENRLLLYKLLEPLGLDLREAVNGREAVEIFEQWHPDLIWMDVRMPVMDGCEATRRIKLTEAGARTKIIALTAHALEEERREILASGCDDLVRKPYRDSEVFDALAKHLGIRFQHADEYPPTAERTTCELNAEQLSRLPQELTDALLKAAELLEGPRILEVIGHIGNIDHELGERLRRMAVNLQYKEMLKILDSLAEKRAR